MKRIDLTKLKVFPLAGRDSMAGIEETLIEPASEPRPLSPDNQQRGALGDALLVVGRQLTRFAGRIN